MFYTRNNYLGSWVCAESVDDWLFILFRHFRILIVYKQKLTLKPAIELISYQLPARSRSSIL
jgi:hypothetical protein